MAYTLRLFALQCVEAQELDGDEIYLKLNGETIFSWDKIGYKFTSSMRTAKHTTQFDFRACQFPTLKGTQKTDAYAPEMFIFEGRTEELTIELWESDKGELLLGGDDRLGTLVISGKRAGNGEQVHLFPLKDAEYELRYTVTADED